VLIICLKRFANGTKIGVKIAFLEDWQSFADEEDDDPQYMLQAHITHFGDSVNSGNVGLFTFNRRQPVIISSSLSTRTLHLSE
jgi:hypothetical protein